MAAQDGQAKRSARRPRSDAAANHARILEVAAGTVKREGSRVPMATIARDATVGIGTVYRHFPTREHLLAGLTERSFGFVLANVQEAAGVAGTARDALAVFFERTIEDRNEFVLPWHDDGPVVRSARIEELRTEVWRLVSELLARGVADGSLRHDVTAADVIAFGAMIAQPLPNLAGWDRVARRQARIYLSGIADTGAAPLSGRALIARAIR